MTPSPAELIHDGLACRRDQKPPGGHCEPQQNHRLRQQPAQSQNPQQIPADLRAAGAYANRLRRRIAETPLQWDGQTIAVTASIGVTEMMPHDASTDAALARADEALYRAKTGGRNRVEVNEAPGPSPTAPAESLSA